MSKISIIGDGYIGKSSLLTSYFSKSFKDEYDPTIEDYYTTKKEINGKEFILEFSDQLGGRGDDYMKYYIIARSNFIMLCFSVVDPDTYEGVRAWHQEILRRMDVEEAPFILVATKIDLRSDPETLKKLDDKFLKPINKEEGELMAREINALAYIETSAKNMIGVDEAFNSAMDWSVKVNEGKETTKSISTTVKNNKNQKSKRKNCLLQ